MSSHIVEVCTIDQVMPHPNADRLELVRVKGWVCVTGKGNFHEGDLALYIPIDSVLTPETEAKLFPEGSKIKLHHHRVKTIKIRGHVSQGMVVRPEELVSHKVKVGDDLAVELGVTKYEPPKKVSTRSNVKQRKKRDENPHFRKYTDLENIKWFPTLFHPGEQVQVTEKIHGTNFRAGWVPFVPRTWWHKVKDWFGWNPEHEFVYGSRNLQLQDTPKRNTYYDTNVYAEAVEKYNLRDRIPKGFVVYGEIYGPDIQNGYHYGLRRPGEIALAIFDVYVAFGPDESELPCYSEPRLTEMFCAANGLPHAPVLYTGAYDAALILSFAQGPSVLAPSQTVREGVVVRSLWHKESGRKILKVINDDYLLSKHADEETAHDMVS